MILTEPMKTRDPSGFEQVQSDKSLCGQFCHPISQHGSIHCKAAGGILWKPGGYVIQESSGEASDTDGNGMMFMTCLTQASIIPCIKDGGIPALKEIKFSLTSNRGCLQLYFCALTFHQGCILQTRSHELSLREAEKNDRGPRF